MSSAVLQSGRFQIAYRAVLTWCLALYTIAVLTTMAGMEIFGWLSATLVLIAVIFMRKDLGLRTPVLEKIDWILIGLCAVICASALFKARDGVDKVFIIGTSRFVFLFLLLRIGFEIVGPLKLKKLMPWLLLLVAIIGVYAIYQNITGIDLIRGHRNPIQPDTFGGAVTYRARGMWDHPVRFGHSIALSLCFPAAFLLSRYNVPKWLRAVSVAALLFAGAGLILSFTRGAWMGFGAALFVMALYIGWRYVAAAAGLALVAAAILIAVSPQVRDRFGSFTRPSADYSSTARLDIWRANIEMFKDNPILGVGYGQNEYLITEYYEKLGITQQDGGHAHNNFIQFLSGTGLAGFLTYLAFSIVALMMAHRLIRVAQGADDKWLLSMGLAAMGAQIVIHVGGLTEASFKSAQINHQYFLILALMVALARAYAPQLSQAQTAHA
jgi:O-antigen ligase